MRLLLLSSLAALAVVAMAQTDPWERRAVFGTAFTTEFPTGSGVEVTKPIVWDNKKGGASQSVEVHVLPNPAAGMIDRINVEFSDRYTDKDSVAMFTEAWGEPAFLPPKRTRLGDYAATEAGWHFAYGDEMKIQLLYEVEIGPGRYVRIDLNCFDPACKKFFPVYSRMRDALRPPPKKKVRR
jgi:hypothetical protein